MAAPMPLAGPVITATRPLSFKVHRTASAHRKAGRRQDAARTGPARDGIDRPQLLASNSLVGRSDFGGRKSRSKISDSAGVRGSSLASTRMSIDLLQRASSTSPSPILAISGWFISSLMRGVEALELDPHLDQRLALEHRLHARPWGP